MKKLTLTAVLLAATATAPSAFAQDVSFSAGVDTVSEYVFRGVSFGDQSIQPYSEVSIGGFTAGAWYSAGFGSESAAQADELDLYIGYSLPLDGPISVDVGATHYNFPQTGALFETDGGSAGTYEVYGSVGLSDFALSPTATVYYDLTLDALTLEGSIGHSFDLPADGWSFDLGLTGGHVTVDDAGSYEWATAGASIGKAFSDTLSFYVGANLSVNSEDLLDFDSFEQTVNLADDLGNVIGTLDVPVASIDSNTKFWFGSGFSVGFE